MPGQQITIRHVAARAGVSRQTVSNTLNAPHRVEESTRALVLAAIEELGYRPNRNARNLAAQQAGLIGYCLPTGRTPSAFMDRFLHQLTAAVEADGKHVLLFTAPDGPTGTAGYAELIAARAVDGFVLTDTVDADPRPPWLAERGVPFVSFGRTWPRDGVEAGPWVDVDGAAACRALVHGLHALGHRRIAFLGWRDATGAMLDRRQGWHTGCTDLGLPANLVGHAAADSADAGAAAAEPLLTGPDAVTAVVAVSDVVAIGVLRAVRAAGRRPGAEVAVTGFDDGELACAVDGGLTSVRQPAGEVAATAVAQLTGRDPRTSVLLPGHIVSRGSAPVEVPVPIPVPIEEQ